MAFDEELRTYLERLEHTAQEKEPVRRRRVDGAALRRHFLERLRALERMPDLVRRRFAQWSPQIEAFARYVEQLPLQDAPLEEEAAFAFAIRALDEGMGVHKGEVGLVEKLEAARVADAFRPLNALGPYALETG